MIKPQRSQRSKQRTKSIDLFTSEAGVPAGQVNDEITEHTEKYTELQVRWTPL